MKTYYILLVLALFLACKNSTSQEINHSTSFVEQSSYELSTGNTIATRFKTPKGATRFKATLNSFAAYLQELPLKPIGSPVLYYNGSKKPNRGVYSAVVDLDVGKRDLQQCADAIMRLRAEYLYEQEDFDTLQFHYTSGFLSTYNKWRAGYRPIVDGNKVHWQKNATAAHSYKNFRAWLTNVYIYAGTLSLEKELRPVSIDDLQIGDVFIQGGSPGHAVIVVDLAKDEQTGATYFMLAQSYMPAQSIHILQNPASKDGSPWYSTDFGAILQTPEWTGRVDHLKRF